jgi:hypothetical protein
MGHNKGQGSGNMSSHVLIGTFLYLIEGFHDSPMGGYLFDRLMFRE